MEQTMTSALGCCSAWWITASGVSAPMSGMRLHSWPTQRKIICGLRCCAIRWSDLYRIMPICSAATQTRSGPARWLVFCIQRMRGGWVGNTFSISVGRTQMGQAIDALRGFDLVDLGQVSDFAI